VRKAAAAADIVTGFQVFCFALPGSRGAEQVTGGEHQ
jgi:hypothetical protein